MWSCWESVSIIYIFFVAVCCSWYHISFCISLPFFFFNALVIVFEKHICVVDLKPRWCLLRIDFKFFLLDIQRCYKFRITMIQIEGLGFTRLPRSHEPGLQVHILSLYNLLWYLLKIVSSERCSQLTIYVCCRCFCKKNIWVLLCRFLPYLDFCLIVFYVFILLGIFHISLILKVLSFQGSSYLPNLILTEAKILPFNLLSNFSWCVFAFCRFYMKHFLNIHSLWMVSFKV